MAGILRDSGWKVVTLTDGSATKSAIQSTIAENLPGSSQFLFYYSGHGTSAGDTAYIVPTDATYDGGDGWLREETLISADEIRGWLSQKPDIDVAAVFDSCFSGKLSGSQQLSGKNNSVAARSIPFCLNGKAIPPKTGNNAFLKGATAGNLKVLTAAGPDEIAYESATLGHGLFTFWLMNTLSDNSLDSDQNSWVSVEESYQFLKQGLRESGHVQVPQLYNCNFGTEYDVATL